MTSQFAKALDFDKVNLGKEAFVAIYATSIGSEAYQYSDKHMGYFSWVLDQAFRVVNTDPNGYLTLETLDIPGPNAKIVS